MNESGGKWTILASIVRSQGRHGEVLAELLTDFPEKFAERKRVFLLPAERAMTLERHWLPAGKNAGRVVLKFAEVTTITEAEELRGCEVAIPREERAALEEDAQYIDDLIGCALVDVTSQGERQLGVVEDVERPANTTPMLVVRRPDGDELLVPFAKAYLARVDVAEKRIEVRLPAGLAELNLGDGVEREEPEGN